MICRFTRPFVLLFFNPKSSLILEIFESNKLVNTSGKNGTYSNEMNPWVTKRCFLLKHYGILFLNEISRRQKFYICSPKEKFSSIDLVKSFNSNNIQITHRAINSGLGFRDIWLGLVKSIKFTIYA